MLIKRLGQPDGVGAGTGAGLSAVHPA